MKKLWIPALLMVLCLALFACGSAGSQKTPDDQENTVNAPDDPTAKEPVSKTDGYTLTVNDTLLAIDAPMAPIVKALGEPGKYFESESCAFQGLDKVYTYGGVVIRTYPIDGKDYILSIELKDDTISTKEGICIGDAKEKLETLGDPDSADSGAVVFRKNGTTLTFLLENDCISAITYTQTAN